MTNRLQIAVFTIFILMVLYHGTMAIDTSKPIQFQHLNLTLHSNRIESILEDHQGFLWIGTLDGLHKYDGRSIITFLPDDGANLEGRRIISMMEDRSQSFWTGTEAGIYKYDRDMDQFKSYAMINIKGDTIPGDQLKFIQDIQEDSLGNVWLLSSVQGLITYDEDIDILVQQDLNPLPANTLFNSMTIDKDQNIWIGTENSGIIKVEPSSQARVVSVVGSSSLQYSGAVQDILADSQGQLWLTYRRNGLLRCHYKSNSIQVINVYMRGEDANSLFNNDISSIYEDRSGKIWICNINGGLHLYQLGTDDFKRFLPNPRDPTAISNISIKTVFEDTQNRLWVGTHLEGLDVYDAHLQKFGLFSKGVRPSDLNNNIVRGFYEDKAGQIWVATDGGGLNILNKNRKVFTKITTQNGSGLSSDAVLTMDADVSGNIWVGTWSGGINVIDPLTKNISQPFKDKTATGEIFYLLRDRSNRIWAANYHGGLDLFDANGNHIRRITHSPDLANSLGNNTVLSIIQRKNGELWFGTEYSGPSLLLEEDQEQFKFKVFAINPEDSTAFPGVIPNHFYEDSNQNLWIASDAGLSKYNDTEQSFRNYFFYHGKEMVGVKAIAEDSKGMLWLGTSKNLIKFNPNTGSQLRTYSKDDGLQAGEFSRNAVLKLSTGEMLFGGYKGFNIFHPDSLFDNIFEPRIHLTNLHIFNKRMEVEATGSPLKSTINQSSEIVLSHKDLVFSLDYVGISFTQPQRVEYAYYLDGFEKEWNYVGASTRATYTNLDPGEYTFYVKAANNDGIWTREPKSLRITILPPWWATIWFRSALVIGVIIVVWLAYRIRVRSFKNTQKQLEMAVMARTVEIEKQKSELKDKNEELQIKNQTISAQAEELQAYNDALNSLNENLEKRVEERTSELVSINKELEEHAFTNSHELRKPVTNILGLVSLTKLKDCKNTDLEQILVQLDEVAKDLDNKVKTIQAKLDKYSINRKTNN